MKYIINEIPTDRLHDIVRDINSYDGSLEYLQYEDIDELYLDLEGRDPQEVFTMFAGGSQNPYHSYWQLDAYGHLYSYNEWDVEQELEDNRDEIVGRLLEFAEEGNTYVDWEEFVEVIEEEEEEEEEEEA